MASDRLGKTLDKSVSHHKILVERPVWQEAGGTSFVLRPGTATTVTGARTPFIAWTVVRNHLAINDVLVHVPLSCRVLLQVTGLGWAVARPGPP